MTQKENNNKDWYTYTTSEFDELEEQYHEHCSALKTYFRLKESGISYFETNTIKRLIIAYESLWYFAHKENFYKAAFIRNALLEFKNKID